MRIPPYNHQYGDSLMVKGVAEWYMVPALVRDVSSFDVFRSSCLNGVVASRISSFSFL